MGMKATGMTTGYGRRTALSTVRAVLAVARKEWIYFLRYPTWIIILGVLPLCFVAQFIYTAKAFSGSAGVATPTFIRLAGTGDYVGYITIGMSVWIWLVTALQDVGSTLRNEQLQGTLEQVWMCPIPRMVLLLGRCLVNLLTNAIWIGSALLEAHFLFGFRLSGDLGLSVLALALSTSLMFGIGILFAALVVLLKEANSLVQLVQNTLLVLCGVIVPVATFPGWVQTLSSWIPVTWAVQGLRAALLSPSAWSAFRPYAARLTAGAVLLPLIGYAAFLYTDRVTRRRGTLQNY